eukprot:TRINITY_DN68860_c0_g1_i1.p1 TRINITY_DN68860_c0_g1~~TRINITY_DN68860_c0_g1_i1.p1  ORF type:complete len:452 (+),score=167.33 TRINITY_DN68860_c0_g1_i1:71-1426(+)
MSSSTTYDAVPSRSAQARADDRPGLLRMEHAVMRLTLSYLDARSVLALAETCRDMADAASQPGVWNERLRADKLPSADVELAQRQVHDGTDVFANIPNLQRSVRRSKLVYLQAKHNAAEAKREQRQQQQRREARRKAAAMRRLLTDVTYHPFQEIIVTLAFPPLVFTTCVMASLSFAQTGATSMDDMWPMLVGVALIAIGGVCVCYTKYAEDPWPFDRQALEQGDGIIKAISGELIGGNHHVTQGVACTQFVLLGLQVVMITCRAVDAVPMAGVSWWIVFAPTWLGCFMFCFIPCTWQGLAYGDRYTGCAAVWAVAIAPVLSFVVMLVVRLDSGPGVISMPFVLIPLFLLDAAALGATCLVNDNRAAMVGLWSVIVGPMVVFEILAAVYDAAPDHGGIALNWLMAPLCVWCALWVVAGLAITALARKDAGRRRERLRRQADEAAALIDDVV